NGGFLKNGFAVSCHRTAGTRAPDYSEKELFDAAIKAGPSRIIVKRPLKSVYLDGREPSYILKGKAIRYDCYVM
ncbi:class I SAM-dependent methyltransferase, partial [Blautia wexlerae]|uniref:class I SAM-dependent methyltransferase n=1 Tax=Blautia wexlerae TaxID=418240 RepID=UPI0034A4D801